MGKLREPVKLGNTRQSHVIGPVPIDDDSGAGASGQLRPGPEYRVGRQHRQHRHAGLPGPRPLGRGVSRAIEGGDPGARQSLDHVARRGGVPVRDAVGRRGQDLDVDPAARPGERGTRIAGVRNVHRTTCSTTWPFPCWSTSFVCSSRPSARRCNRNVELGGKNGESRWACFRHSTSAPADWWPNARA